MTEWRNGTAERNGDKTRNGKAERNGDKTQNGKAERNGDKTRNGTERNRDKTWMGDKSDIFYKATCSKKRYVLQTNTNCDMLEQSTIWLRYFV